MEQRAATPTKPNAGKSFKSEDAPTFERGMRR
jgi:hypothetical protein